MGRGPKGILQYMTYKTTKFSCRGSTLSIRVVGSHNDRSIPFVFKERRNVYLPDFGLPVSGSTLRRIFGYYIRKWSGGKKSYFLRTISKSVVGLHQLLIDMCRYIVRVEEEVWDSVLWYPSSCVFQMSRTSPLRLQVRMTQDLQVSLGSVHSNCTLKKRERSKIYQCKNCTWEKKGQLLPFIDDSIVIWTVIIQWYSSLVLF